MQLYGRSVADKDGINFEDWLQLSRMERCDTDLDICHAALGPVVPNIRIGY